VAILFSRVAWMENYQGSVNDKPQRGGTYVEENETGSEIHNYSTLNIPVENSCLELTHEEYLKDIINVCQGFVMTQGTINIERLGASKVDDYIEGVLVVWVATHPYYGGMRIVGWYKNATVFREFQDPSEQKNSPWDNDFCYYNVRSRSSDAVLINSSKRNYVIPQGKGTRGGFGRNNTWFADKEKDQAIVKGVYDFIQGYEGLAKESTTANLTMGK
jgi:5-methylcytosine-specific restriction protein A